MSASGTLFTGENLQPQPVTFEFTAAGLRLETGGDVREVPASEFRISDRLGQIPRFLYLPGGAVLETLDNAAVDAALLSGNRDRGARFIHRLETHPVVAAVACVALVTLLALTFHYAPPAVARVVARRVPASVERRAGDVALGGIAPYFHPSNLTATERAHVQRQLQRLRPVVPGKELPRLEFRSFANGLPNAFALPGDVIVVTDELVRLPIHDDELVAVLAHEIGHLQARHGIQSVLRSSFALLIVSAVTGDLSTLTSFAAAIPLTLLNKGYSRDMEREADTFALAALRTLTIAPTAFTSVLLKLDTARLSLARTSTYLSTHPSTDERTRMFGELDEDEKSTLLAEGEANPQVLTQTRPVYPIPLRRAKVEGDVVLEFVVDIAGDVKMPRVVSSSDHRFDGPALLSVQQWKFRPGRSHFRAVEKTMRVPLLFRLNEEPAAPSTPGETKP